MSGFTIVNLPGPKFYVRADLDLVIHGFETPGGNPATLILINYTFGSEDRARPIKSAAIEFRFFKEANPQATPILEPEVIGVHPVEEYHKITPAEKTASTIVTTSIGAGSTGMIQALGGVTLSNAKTTHLEEKAIIFGTRRFSNRRDYSIEDIARWKITENPSDPGIPTQFTTKILLKRKSLLDPFAATVQIDVEIDIRRRVGEAWDKFRGNKPVADPIYFDPSLEPQGSIPEGLDTQNLKKFWDEQIVSPRK